MSSLIQFTGKEISFAEFGFPDEFVVSVEREGQLINLTVSKNEMIALVEEAGAFAQGSSYWYPDTALEAVGLGVQWANNLLIALVGRVESLFTGEPTSTNSPAPLDW